ncbi:MAG TPA: hypothetical protein VHE37_01155 [Nevskiaceae bacterium]|nr:hypothetical protein [Nevskiaceae bacterium]
MNNRALLFVVIGAAVLAGLFVLMKPAAEPQAVPAAPAAAAAPDAAAPVVVQPRVHAFELVVKDRRLVSGPQLLSVNQGDAVTIGIVSDAAEELHLHGYNLKLELAPNQHAVLAFNATHSGHFEYELEHARVELGALEVQPQ